MSDSWLQLSTPSLLVTQGLLSVCRDTSKLLKSRQESLSGAWFANAVFQYPPKSSPEYRHAVAKTEPLRRAMLRRQLCNSGVHIHSAFVGDKVAGFAIWAPPKTAERYIPWHLRGFDLLLQLWDALYYIVYPPFIRRFFDKYDTERLRRRDLIQAADAEYEEKIIPEDVKQEDYWSLAALGVSDEFERRGIGSQLLKWGMDAADKSDKAIVVAASIEGERLYTKHGFVTMDRTTLLPDQPGGGVTQVYMLRLQKSKRDAKNIMT